MKYDFIKMAELLVSPFLFYLAFINVVTFSIFAWDKFQSARNGWRIPEKTLLLLAAIGGSPSMLLAQETLRHKTRKQPFKSYLLLIVLIQLIGFGFVVFKFTTD